MKNILLPIFGVAIFIALVGLLTQKAPNLKVKVNKEVPVRRELTLAGIAVRTDIADTEPKRKNGLSGREKLGDSEGMLFVFDNKGIYPSFWMKDMKFPIDIIWIADGKVSKIDKNVPVPSPNTTDSALTLYHPDKPIDFVLEVNAGFSDKNNVAVGSSVENLP